MDHKLTTAQTRRRRTPEQLERKRLLDKITQKQKREQKRTQSRQVSDDLRNLQDEVERLQGVIMRITRGQLEGQGWNSFTVLYSAGNTDTALPSRSMPALNAVASVTGSRLDEPFDSTPLQSLSPISGNTSNGPTCVPWYSTGISPYTNDPKPVIEDTPVLDRDFVPFLEDCQLASLRTIPQVIEECLCDPRIHNSYEECFEATLFNAIVGVAGHSDVGAIFRKPPSSLSLDDLFGTGGNVVSKVVKRLISTRSCAKLDLSLLLGIHIILYRVLRYRLFPSLDTYADIPEWLHPTRVQDNTPHPIFIDFIHFPELRDALTLGLVAYNRAEFNHNYLYHISLNWPVSKDLLVVDSACNIILNPDFEAHVLGFNNWSLDKEFSIKHPQMATLVITKEIF